MATAPEPLANGGDYVGYIQDIDNSYTGAAIILAGATSLQDYSIEGDVYCYVNHPGLFTFILINRSNACA